MADAATLVGALRAAGETTRLRLLALLAEGEHSVKDLTEILRQSQPRVSRHLKLLAVARAKLRAANIGNAQVRLGDLADLDGSAGRADLAGVALRADLVIIHQVLHYFDDPGRALAQAKRALKPGGEMLIIDFAPHELEFLR